LIFAIGCIIGGEAMGGLVLIYACGTVDTHRYLRRCEDDDFGVLARRTREMIGWYIRTVPHGTAAVLPPQHLTARHDSRELPTYQGHPFHAFNKQESHSNVAARASAQCDRHTAAHAEMGSRLGTWVRTPSLRGYLTKAPVNALQEALLGRFPARGGPLARALGLRQSTMPCPLPAALPSVAEYPEYPAVPFLNCTEAWRWMLTYARRTGGCDDPLSRR
jgi:hypothetical protein